MKRKLLSCLLSLVLVTSFLTVSASAVNDSSLSSTTSSTSIPENVAEIIAGYFIQDMLSMPDITWSEETSIVNSQTMYAPDGEISAYSFELQTNGNDNGYVVVSAYPDIENGILEFSDESTPVYESFNLDANDVIIYTGNLNYFKSAKDSNLVTAIDGTTLLKKDVSEPLEASRNTSSAQTQADYPISDPIVWANEHYGGPYVATEWKNPFENNCKFRYTSLYYGYTNHCAPVAITNLIEIVGYYRGYIPVTSKSGSTGSGIFNPVVQLGLKNEYYKNAEFKDNGGTLNSSVSTYIKESFSLFNINVSVNTQSSITYRLVKNAINSYKPICIILHDHSYYGNHAVTGYAYTYLQNQSSKTYLGFVKIADGRVSNGRYLPTSYLVHDTMHIVTVGSLG